jgi:indole-3-glycerol phosphate synthase
VWIIAKKREEFAKYKIGYIKSSMGILQEIVSKKKERLKDSKFHKGIRELKGKISDIERPRDLAEIKKASPSKGIIKKSFDHLSIARVYEEKSVNAVSVLTEEDFFQGSLTFLPDIKKVTTRPLLRKDFIFDEYQIYESRAYEADAILLIASILEKSQAAEYLHLAGELGLSVLFEVHDSKELEMVLMRDCDIIGINNRDLTTLKIDMNTTFSLKQGIPSGKIIVSESGVRTAEDVRRLEDSGIDAILIGTTFMAAEDIGRKIDELMNKM